MTEQEAFHLYRPHPWHGLDLGPEPPSLVTAFIEHYETGGIKQEPVLFIKTHHQKIENYQHTVALGMDNI